MKHWIKRSLFGLFGGALVIGSIAGCAGQRHGWSGMTEQDRAEFRTKVVDRVGSKLDLDTAQKQRLSVLAEKLQAQRTAMRDAGGAGGTRSQFTSLFAGARLDQAGASKLIDEKTAVLRNGSPEVIAAAADFFDNLNPSQQVKVREFMERGRRWHRG
ncbi:Spy/CpxP family protein refolding chaperone [Variovorax sp. PAMC 28711]|uniref:Spy/CpxP family protein refolding chaperone n=1 Tax=Variovorax sp. PAMC 28711 TaxID=1795631 RepID=UPI00078D4F21|nr:hypothetical protein [Variovorax sp. PAMC 28711]AMM24451.1 hypothetical protein AX767_08880 [Variovorax sp. PAMC 28711]